MLDLTPLGTLGAWMVLPEGKTGFHPPRRTVIAQGYASHPRKGMYGHHLQARTARRRTGSCALLTANSCNHNSWQSGAQALVTINKGHDICTHDKIKAPHCGRRGLRAPSPPDSGPGRPHHGKGRLSLRPEPRWPHPASDVLAPSFREEAPQRRSQQAEAIRSSHPPPHHRNPREASLQTPPPAMSCLLKQCPHESPGENSETSGNPATFSNAEVNTISLTELEALRISFLPSCPVPMSWKEIRFN
ncbi:unnamed protein product [Rangifer tarandus platyrhynchus]|uniref:Uncharacterized protein n=1 Tax=Rangifer tarandus platyrhynchus TaxID=3082113 RepID=A0ACB1KI22_RANTA